MRPPHPSPTRKAPSAGWRTLATMLLVSSSAAAQEPTAPEAPEVTQASEPPPSPSEEDSGTLKLPTAFGSVEVGGRISVRETVDAKGEDALAGKLSIPAARLEVTYRWKKRLKAVVEFDVQSGLRDAFVWLDLPKGLAVRAGQFKVPLSLVELESTTKLPLVRRGLGRDVLRDALGLTGRQLGAQLEWKCTACTRPLKLQAGVWQSDPDEEVELDKGLGLVPMFRGTWGVLDTLELGTSLQARPSSTDGTWSNWTAGIDAKHALPIGQGELRTWAEVLVGRNELMVGTEGPLLTARALTAWRIGDGKKGGLYVEPFVMLAALDPDLQNQKDLLWEGAGGINFGQRGRWRLQAQAEVRQAEESIPTVVRSLEKTLVPRRAMLLQMEVGF